MKAEIPSDASRYRLLAFIAAALFIVFVATAIGVWIMIRSDAPAPKQKTFEPAQETTAAPRPGSVAPTSPAPHPAPETSTASPVPEKPPLADTAPKASRSVAFNLGGRLYVSNLSGSRITQVAPKTDLYSLSPDGTKVAIVMANRTQAEETGAELGQIAVIDVATKSVVGVGSDAVGHAVSWSPDSTWFAYTAQEGEGFAVKRVQADGSRDRALVKPGAIPRVSNDGLSVAYKDSEQLGVDDPLMILTIASKESRAVPEGRDALAWGWSSGGRLYFTKQSSSAQDWNLWRHKKGAKSSVKVGSVALEAPAFTLTDVRVSPDGKKVLMSAGGDDQYSRLWVFDTMTERFSAIRTRRDAYPCCWAGNNQILYFEGNTYQGESSALARIDADGTGRRLVVTGAHR